VQGAPLRRTGGLSFRAEAVHPTHFGALVKIVVGGTIIHSAFATGKERLWAIVGTWNAASFRVLEKNGFHPHHNGYGERGEFVWMVRHAAQ
jgi:hypothetical protein